MKVPINFIHVGWGTALLALSGINAGSAPKPDVRLFDFSQPDAVRPWRVVNDDVMGGVSTSQFLWKEGVAVFKGTVSLENNGGFASVRTQPGEHDLTGTDAFVIRVRGDGRRYKFTVRTEGRYNAALYQASFETRQGEWQEIKLPFSQFTPTWRGRILRDVPPLDPAKVNSVGFLIADKQAGPFRLEIGWIRATRSNGE
ncbi:MAG: CIA30 family protein [Verrucomicrobia bacterium]|nr:MAG: CIA30 family protein [Verrucomicrobiota bacterium]